VRRDPRAFGIPHTRWTLAAIHRVCDWLRVGPLGSLAALLDRLGLSWKGARWHVRSPDPAYEAKLAYVRELGLKVRASGGTLVLVYLDELTFYRQPALAPAWEERGPEQPRAERSYRTNTPSRVVAALNLVDARVTYRRRGKVGVDELVGHYRDLRAAYPEAERIYAVQDNWPTHTHPDVLVALEPQQAPWPYHRPPNWPDAPHPAAQERWGDLHLPIQIIPLPTYASWTNPIEKLWRWLYAEVLHLHRRADRLDELRREVDAFLDQFAGGSLALLRYVGLLVPT
jgi:transposase